MDVGITAMHGVPRGERRPGKPARPKAAQSMDTDLRRSENSKKLGRPTGSA